MVFGLGGIGLNVIAGARIAGARMIIGVDTNEAKRAAALRAGVTHFVNPREVEGDLVGYLTELTGGGADYAFDCAGHESVLNQAIACTHRGWGTVIMIGIMPGAGLMHIPQRSILAGRTLKGSLLGNVKMRSQLPQLVDWFMEGSLPLGNLISHRIKLDQINAGFDLMVAGKSLRTIIEYD